MARNLMKKVIGATNRLFSSVQDTSWSTSFDSLISRWQQFEDEMNYARESKKLPLRWCPPANKEKLSSITLAEDSLLKQLSNKCSAKENQESNEIQQLPRGEDDSLKNLYDEVFEEAGRRYREKIRTSKKAMKKRLDEEQIPTSSDGPRLQKHSMINPQRLFTPVKKSPSFTREKPLNYDQKLKQRSNTSMAGQTVTTLAADQTVATATKDKTVATPTKDKTVAAPTKDKTVAAPTKDNTVAALTKDNTVAIPTKDNTVMSKSNTLMKDTPKKGSNIRVNLKQSQSVQPPYEPIHPAASPLVPTHQMIDPSAPTQNMTSSLPPAHHITSPLVPTHPITGTERQTFSQQWNFNRMQRVENQFAAPSDMSYKRTSQKPKITFIQPKKSQTLYRYIGSNIPATYITGPITSRP